MSKPKKSQWIRSWFVQGSEPEPYKVSEHRDGHFGCSCKRWIFCRAPKVDCHHIDGVKLSLGLAVGRAVTVSPEIGNASEGWSNPGNSSETVEVKVKVKDTTERLFIRSIRKEGL